MVDEKDVPAGVAVLVRNQKALLGSVHRASANFKKDSPERKTEAYFRRRLESLDKIAREFHENHKIIMATIEDTDAYIQKSMYDQFEEAHIEACSMIESAFVEAFPPARLTDEITVTRNETMSDTGGMNYYVNLPKLNLPTFNGDCLQWPSFFDAFNAIHTNSSIPNAQKFRYLKGLLTGPAELLVRHLPITDANYVLAISELEKTYNNVRLVLTDQLNTYFGQPVIKAEDQNEMQELLSVSRATMHGISKLGATLESVFVHMTLQKLPPDTRVFCLQSFPPRELPTWNDLEEAVTTRINSLPFQQIKHINKNSSDHKSNYARNSNNHRSTTSSTFHAVTDTTCPMCDGAHNLRACPDFVQMSTHERRAAASRFKHCFNCLGRSHLANVCPSKQNCRVCGAKHHTMLHLQDSSNSRTQSQTSKLSPGSDGGGRQVASPKVNHVLTTTRNTNQILLATAILTIKNKYGEFVKVRALLDQGSQASLITEAAVQRLELPKTRVRARIHGVGSGPVNQSKGMVSLSLGSCYNSTFQLHTEALVLNSLTTRLPTQYVNCEEWNHIQNIQLADPQFMSPGRIDLLLGADIYAELLVPGLRRGGPGTPIAQNTVLGWILSGKIGEDVVPSIAVSNFHTQVEIDDMLRKFWELEEVPTERACSQEDEWCEEFFKATCRRQPNGKYMVQLPLKTYFDPTAVLGSSRPQALRRYFHLERRLQTNPKLKEEYGAVIQEYLDLGQMIPEEREDRPISEKANIYESCYLPHHPVIKESSTTTKLRVVFDASARTSNGRSLNDILATGPPLQTDLVKVILRWRTLKYVFTTDIEKMYRRIEMHNKDIDYQKIIWRDAKTGKIETFRLNTVTFGTASAPYTAIRVMHQLADDMREQYPQAAYAIKHEMYVDDILSGGDDIASAVSLQAELIGCLGSACFELRKWAGNCPEVLASIPVEHREAKGDFQLNSEACIKALGMYWSTKGDNFNYKINFELEREVHTKRSVLSTIARLFDPLGWINPIIVSAKIFLKQLWCRGLDWDDALPSDLLNGWNSYIGNLKEIDKLSIPRWINTRSSDQHFELHTFCDGSLEAYSAVTYMRVRTSKNETFIHLLMGKCKVSPKQKLTIPRLELCGATLAVKLHTVVRSTLDSRFSNVTSHFWTDSTIVLAWLKGDPDRWKTFVCNRIHTILRKTNVNQWHHVGSTDNPADVSSRGVTVAQLKDHELWWHGPTWLQSGTHDWSSIIDEDSSKIRAVSDLEMKKAYMVNAIIINKNTYASTINECSSYTRLVRITAWCLRFINNARRSFLDERNLSCYLSSDELHTATTRLQRIVQEESFPQEIVILKQLDQLSHKSKLTGLNPFLDGSGILRVGGRLKNALLTFQEKHPVILPSSHHFTKLFIDFCHARCLHGGLQLTLNHIRKTCWIPQARRVVGNHLRKCIRCFKTRPITSNQLMGNLPHVRVRPSRPFAAAGVDYAGPIDMRVSKGRGNKSYKGYIAVFVCLSTKAIHLEAVSDLSTPAFLAALQRFFARRGLSKDIYSDCGRNFVGANNQLVANMNFNKNLMEREILPVLTMQQVTWHFIPPFSPHFGGLWEAGVKSMKYHLKRIIPNATLTFEEITTVLCRVESCLNSRPLCPLSDRHDDFTVLTPGHFLIGDTLLSPPEEPEKNLSLTNRWHQLQKITLDFWKSWSKEYLSRLQLRPKWNKNNKDINIGDLVLIKQDNLPPNFWKLGRILQLHFGTDNLARVVTVKTQDGVFKRPVTKICKLPKEEMCDTDVSLSRE